MSSIFGGVQANASANGRVGAALADFRSTPDSNTGVKSFRTAGVAGTGFTVRLDALTFTFSGGLFGFDVGLVRRWISSWSGGLLSVGGRLSKRYNGYPECWEIVVGDGFKDKDFPSLGWVGMSWSSDNMRGRCCICLTGSACSLMDDWSSLAKDMRDYSVNITRVDIALDDYAGVHDLSEAMMLYDAGSFVTRGQPPESQYIKNAKGKDKGKGNTFYVGSRQSAKYLRVYEKGRQLLKMKKSRDEFVNESILNWVRWELELKACSRVIPYDVLVNPVCYLKGAYPDVFTWIDAASVSIKSSMAKVALSFHDVMVYAKRQVSRVVRYCFDAGMPSDDIVASLIAEPGRYPIRLFGAEHLELCPSY